MPLSFAKIRNAQEEFWYHVSRQDELPLATSKQEATEIVVLNTLADKVAAQTHEQLAASLSEMLIRNPKLLDWLRTLISVSDKRLYLGLR